MIFPATLSLISSPFYRRSERALPSERGPCRCCLLALGPGAGGWLLAHFAWKAIFFAMAPVAALGQRLIAFSVSDLT